jgi:methylated-DNA-[protein]-cysteine S-methyltransferase
MDDRLDFAEAFLTALGWTVTVGKDDLLKAVVFGYDNPQQALSSAERGWHNELAPHAWNPELSARLQAFAEGGCDDFLDLQLDLDGLSPFQRKVVDKCRRIPFGETVSYGELAEMAGSPRAARAVGNVMANNRFPLVVPCHRVVASGGGLGGYSARQGVRVKRRLIALERQSREALLV